MEILKVSKNSIKIKGKQATVVTDPTEKSEAEIVIATEPQSALALDKLSSVRLVISGPGEYEVGGISVSCKKSKNSFTCTLYENSKVLLVKSSAVQDIPDDEEYDCVIVQVVEPFSDEVLGPINTKCIVLYGDLAQAKIKTEDTQSVSKVSLKKLSEVQGKTFLFE